MMSLKIKIGLVCQNLITLQWVTSIMPLEIDLGLVCILAEEISWKPTDSVSGMIDNLGNQILDNDSRFESVFCYDHFNWQNRFCLFFS